jgi:hypothetical protein
VWSEGSRSFRLPDFMTFGTWKWWGCQTQAPAVFTQGMFLVLIFTRGLVDPSAMEGRKEICHWKIQWNHWESMPGPSDYQRSALTTTQPQAPFSIKNRESHCADSPLHVLWSYIITYATSETTSRNFNNFGGEWYWQTDRPQYRARMMLMSPSNNEARRY